MTVTLTFVAVRPAPLCQHTIYLPLQLTESSYMLMNNHIWIVQQWCWVFTWLVNSTLVIVTNPPRPAG